MRLLTVFVALLAAGGFAVPREVAAVPAVFRSFDGPQITWQLEDGRPGAMVLAHGCVTDDARQGTGSERVVVAAPAGESLHFICPVGRVPVLDELETRMWVKANRPGVVLAARVVLPRSVDAATGTAKMALVSGAQYAEADRWQQLALAGVPNLLADQVRALRAAPGAQIDSREAYVDAIVLVVPGGPDSTAVWTDALEVDGIVIAPARDNALAGASPASKGAARAAATSQGWRRESSTATGGNPPGPPLVQCHGTTLLVAGKPFVSRGIQWNDEPFAFLAARGFNTIWTNEPPTDEQSVEAARAGVWLVCSAPHPDELTDDSLGESLDRVLAWHLGSPAGPHELDYFRRWAARVRERDPLVTRPIVVTPRSDWLPCSRLADVLLADHPVGSNLSEPDFAEWLEGLPLLARPGSPFWASLPTQPGERIRQQLAALSPGSSSSTAIDERQLEALVTAAATSGCRGFLFKSDSPLDAADEISKRRALLLELVNDRLELIGPWLTMGKRVGQVASVDSTATASLLQVERARLLVPTSLDNDMSAAGKSSAESPRSTSIAFIVPGVPESNESFLLFPAGLRTLPSKRVAGGTRIVLDRSGDDDGLVLMTEDRAVIAGFRERVARGGRRAAQLQYSLAVAQARSVAETGRRLGQLGIDAKSLNKSVGTANAEIGRASSLLAAGNMDAAYQRAAAARRILAEAIHQQGLDSVDSPQLDSIPFGAGHDMLLQRVPFEKTLASLRGGDNLLSGGDFEDLDQLKQLGWLHVDDAVAGVETRVELSGRNPHEGRYCLELSALAAPPEAAPQIVARPLVWITSPPVRATATAGQVLEISGWVWIPQPITGSIEGLQIVDSLGGPELSLRVRGTSNWQPFRMIRGVAETTDVTLTCALTGLGTAYVDGVMIRELSPPGVKRLPTVISEPGPVFPSSARRDRPLFDAPRPR